MYVSAAGLSQHLPLGRPTTGEPSAADEGRALLTFSSGPEH
jgi:hypothetical protein